MPDYFCSKCGQPMPRNYNICYDCNIAINDLKREEIGSWESYYGIDDESWDDGDYDEIEDEYED